MSERKYILLVSFWNREIDPTVVEREKTMIPLHSLEIKKETMILKGFSLLELSLSVGKSPLIEIE